MADLAKKIDGKKYMWDGKEYPDRGAAEEIEKKYKEKEFETRILEEGGADYKEEQVVVDENIVTGFGPLAAKAFAEAVINLLK